MPEPQDVRSGAECTSSPSSRSCRSWGGATVRHAACGLSTPASRKAGFTRVFVNRERALPGGGGRHLRECRKLGSHGGWSAIPGSAVAAHGRGSAGSGLGFQRRCWGGGEGHCVSGSGRRAGVRCSTHYDRRPPGGLFQPDERHSSSSASPWTSRTMGKGIGSAVIGLSLRAAAASNRGGSLLGDPLSLYPPPACPLVRYNHRVRPQGTGGSNP